MWKGLSPQARLSRGAAKELKEVRDELLDWWGEHPWNWLAAIDYTSPTPEFPDGRPVVWTKDEGDKEHPIKPWPDEKARPYLRRYIEDIHMGTGIILVDKPRQVMVTHATLQYADWDCRFHPVRRWLLSKSTEDEAIELLEDKPRFVHTLLPEWVKLAMPQQAKPAIKCRYPTTKSYILAVAQNAAAREIRGGTSSGIIVDEAARQTAFKDMMDAALPASARVIAMTTAELGNAGAAYFDMLRGEQ